MVDIFLPQGRFEKVRMARKKSPTLSRSRVRARGASRTLQLLLSAPYHGVNVRIGGRSRFHGLKAGSKSHTVGFFLRLFKQGITTNLVCCDDHRAIRALAIQDIIFDKLSRVGRYSESLGYSQSFLLQVSFCTLCSCPPLSNVVLPVVRNVARVR